MDLELRQLRALVAVVDEGGFTDAATALGLSQATVSRTVAGLERALGARLVQRSTRPVSPTVVGSRVLDHARRALAEAAALRRTVEDATGGLRVGFAWSALGHHTTTVQQRWAAAHPTAPLLFVQSNSPTAGLTDGVADVAVLRRPLDDRRFRAVMVGVEPRYLTVASSDPLSRKRTVALADLAGRTVAIDARTGTTTADLFPPDAPPGGTREVHGVDEWLTLIAGGSAVGISAQATAHQYPRPGIAYRRVRDAAPVPVWLAWWRDEPPALADELVGLVCEVYAAG